MLNLPISRDAFIWAFSIASQINRVPLAATFLLQRHQAPFTLGSFRAAAEQTGFKVRQKAVPNSQLMKLPLPCLVTLMPVLASVPLAAAGEPAAQQQAIGEYQLALLERIDEQCVVLAEACSKVTITISREAFEKRFAGEALLITPHQAVKSPANTASQKTVSRKKAKSKLGPAWFMPQPGWLRAMFRSSVR